VTVTESRAAAPRAPGVGADDARTGFGRVVAVTVLLVAAGWFAVWLLTDALAITSTQPRWATPVRVGAGVFGAVVAGSAALLTLRGSRLAAAVVVAGTSVTTVGLATVALHGTRWSFNALYSDAGFRTEAATRFADSPVLRDYGYRGLPSYYPPALPWLQGRLAAVLGEPAWATMKPTMLVLAAGVPLLAFLLWRRVVPDLTAALVVAGTTLATSNLVKPDEWLVLALVVPWWLELTRDLRSPGHRALPWWVHGLVLGGLLLWHSFFFVPLAVATVLGMAVDVVRRRPPPMPWRRALAVAATGLVVSAPYWAPMTWLRFRGAPTDNLQMRWSDYGWEWPPWPLPLDLPGALAMLGVAWLVWRARTNRLAESLTVALVAAYAFFLGGQWLQRFDVALLPQKAGDLIAALLAVSTVLALSEVARTGSPGRRRRMAAVAVACVLAVAGVVTMANATALGSRRAAALHTRYPDGSYPAGGPATAPTTRHPWNVSPGDPSVAQVSRAWTDLSGRPLDADTVLVTVRADLLATSPVHPFIAWKSIYSHPEGRFKDRLALLREVGRCPDPRCAARLLTHNPFDRVDGLVLSGSGQQLELPVAVDTFPDGWVKVVLPFPRDLFRAPYFTVRQVGTVTVVAVTGGSAPPSPR
jgi:galactan 5-O-arabinofuranosyltransferase